MQQHAGDPHYLMVGTPSLLTNHITGLEQAHYNDFTPIASLFNDYVVFAVNADSPIKTGKDLDRAAEERPEIGQPSVSRRRSAATTTSPRAC